MDILISIALAILVSTGGLWYTVGMLKKEVQQHNKTLGKVEKVVDQLLAKSVIGG